MVVSSHRHAGIVTLTMNPALDQSTSTHRVEADHKLRCSATVLHPGGGGVNVSRAIDHLGGASAAVYLVGGPSGAHYQELLAAEGITGLAIPIEGNIRSNLTVWDETDAEEYRFVLQGPTLSEGEWAGVLDELEPLIEAGGFVVASGSLPPGVPVDFYARVAKLAADKGASVIVDASGPALAAALDAGVHLVAPSRYELGELVGETLDTVDEQLRAATRLIELGKTELVALTLGADGAILVSAEGVLRLPSARIEVRSTVGAGDSFLAAFLLRRAEGRTLAEALRTAVAAGGATAMLPGTELCRAEDVRRLESELAVPA